MARADLLLSLARGALRGDVEASRATVEAIAAEEDRKRHTVLARQLAAELTSARPQRSSKKATTVSTRKDDVDGLQELLPKRRLAELQLPAQARLQLDRLIEEHHRSDLLRNFGLEARHKLLLVGPPGNGKTSTAEALATDLAVPLLVVRYEQVITSYLGETAEHIELIMDEARRRHCVLFLDEFDVVGKERADEHETGEIKRVVSSLLLQLDRLPSHVILVAATNHAQLLDSGVWRRFDIQIELPLPTEHERRTFVTKIAEVFHLSVTAATMRYLLNKLEDASYADLESTIMYLRRREVLLGGAWNQASAKEAVLEAVQLRSTRQVNGTR